MPLLTEKLPVIDPDPVGVTEQLYEEETGVPERLQEVSDVKKPVPETSMVFG
jgi:hypothetical protein